MRTGNLLTGQLYVALDIVDGAPPAKVAWDAVPPELPTSKGDLQALQATLTSIAKKLDALPYEQIATDLRRAIASLDSTLKSAEVVVRKLGDEVAPDIIIKLWGNAFGLMLLCGLLFALIRRLLVRPAQLDNKEADLSLLFLLLWLTLSGFALEALRLSLAPVEVGQYSFVSNLMAARGNYTPVELTPWLTALWTIHGLSGVALVAYVPHSKLMHSILAPLVLALNAQAEHKRKDLYWSGTARHRAIRSREI